MTRRAHSRFHADAEARLFFGNIFYTAQVTNLSEGGMFVSTGINFPLDSVFVTVMLMNDHTLNIISRVKRTVKPTNHGSAQKKFGMGIELINPSRDYINYVRSFRTSGNRSDY